MKSTVKNFNLFESPNSKLVDTKWKCKRDLFVKWRRDVQPCYYPKQTMSQKGHELEYD